MIYKYLCGFEYFNLIPIISKLKSPRGVVGKDLDCKIDASKFKIQSCNNVHVCINNLGKI